MPRAPFSNASPAAEQPAALRLSVRSLGRHLPASAGIIAATVVLFVVSALAERQSVGSSAVLGMLPFAAVLAIVAAGQTLVIQQGGIDLSVPGVVSLTIVLLTKYPNEDSGKLPVALLMALGAALAAGIVTGLIVSRIGITPIVTTLGMNALLYGGVIQLTSGRPTNTTTTLHDFATSNVVTRWIPTTVVIALAIVAVVSLVIKKTVVGRRFEAVGANAVAARAAGLEQRRYQVAAYAGATFLYFCGATLLAGVIGQPSAFTGDQYLLPSVAAVVLGGTSLLGGVGSVVASAAGALFLVQLEQLVLTTGASTSVQYLIEAGAIAAGVAIHSVRRGELPAWLPAFRRRAPDEVPLDERGSVGTSVEA
jgi:ribose transport system permease protein